MSKSDLFALLQKSIVEIANEHPHAWYEGDECLYTEGDVIEGDDREVISCGCLIGQGIVRSGLTTKTRLATYEFNEKLNKKVAMSVMGIMKFVAPGTWKFMTDEEYEWLAAVQCHQDEGYEWANCITYANRYFPGVKP